MMAAAPPVDYPTFKPLPKALRPDYKVRHGTELKPTAST